MFYQTMDKNNVYSYHSKDDKETLKKRIESGDIKKVEVNFQIDDLERKESDGTLFNTALEYVQKLIPFYEYIMSSISEDAWWPSLSEYDPGLSYQKYHDYFLDENIVKRSWLEALHELYRMPDHTATCKQLGERFGHAPSHYISYLASAASNIVKATNITVPTSSDENSRYWPVLFQGKSTVDRSQGSYIWKMRKPVAEAIGMLMKQSKSPSGAGETNGRLWRCAE